MSREFKVHKNGIVSEALDSNLCTITDSAISSEYVCNKHDDNVLKESSSGFILLSVKHMSNAREEKTRKRSYTGTNNCMRFKPLNKCFENFNSGQIDSHNLLSPTSDAGNTNFGSGSIDADEFEDSNELDEFENNFNDNDLFESKANHCFVNKVNCNSDPRVSNQIHCLPPGTHLISELENNQLYLYNDQLNGATPKQFPVSHYLSSCEWSKMTNNGVYPHFISHEQCAHSQCNYNSSHYGQLVTSDNLHCEHDHFAFSDHLVCNNVENNAQNCAYEPNTEIDCIDQLPSNFTSPRKHQFCALPIVRPVNAANYEFPTAHHNSSNWGNLNEVLHQSYRRSLSSRLKHGNYSQSSLTCPYYLHPSTVSNNFSSELDSSVTNHLPSDVVKSLPPLQPASRFRKARIHETVEQWSYDRCYVHDCHLKAVPEWVKVLQKKASTHEQTLANAMNTKVRCISCVLPDSSDNKDSGCENVIRSHHKSHNAMVTNSKLKLMHNKLDSLKNTLDTRALFLNCSPQANNLFSFWHNGLRVHRRLPSLTYVDIKQCEQASNFGDICNVCGNSVDKFAGIKSTYPNNNNCDAPRDLVNDETCHGYIIKESIEPCNLQNSLDPATAYLRRCQTNSDISPENIDDRIDNSTIDNSLAQSLRDNGSSKAIASQISPPNINPSKQVNDRMLSPQVKLPAKSSNLSPTSLDVDKCLANKSCRKHCQLNRSCNCHRLSPLLKKSKVALSNSILMNDDHNCNHYRYRRYYHQNHVNGLILASDCDVEKSCKNEFDSSLPNHSSRRLNSRSNNKELSPTSILYEKIRASHMRSVECRSKSRESNNCHSDSCCSPPHSYTKPNLHTFKRACTTGSIVDLTDEELSKDIVKFAKENDSKVSKESSVLSDRLEARIRASMEAIRSSLVSSFRDELTTILTENVSLRSELNILNSELRSSMNYHKAISAFRSFVPSDIFKKICSENGLSVDMFAESGSTTNQTLDRVSNQ